MFYFKVVEVNSVAYVKGYFHPRITFIGHVYYADE